ncbi:MAG TPA: A/G-specific adenine glycosylase [Bacteroidales bacterium]|nr:A/G-specific adenine glycosylase [Bacteroidales bacterium]
MLKISKTLLTWYEQNKRPLPWRETNNPYSIWISEIILQQTRVNQGINYYYRFIKHFPDIYALANAPVEEVLKIWQGLGYYSRARNMHCAAHQIINNFEGKFPARFQDLLKLKGVGEYTAAAIASIAFHIPEPALDGNVYRVLSRLFGIAESPQKAKGKKIFKQKAFALIQNQPPGIFNQALMEFGALQCMPKNPDCHQCVLQNYCFAFQNKLVTELPVKKTKINQRLRYINFLYIQYQNKIFIEQRKKNDIWKLLYQLPLIETKQPASIENITNQTLWKKVFKGTKVNIQNISGEKIHHLSHQKLLTRFYHIKINHPNSYLIKNYLQINSENIEKYSVPKLIENYLDEINN